MDMPTDKDFAALDAWGMADDPLAALADFSPLKAELRWLNPYHRQAHYDYIKAREGYMAGKDFEHYYKTARKPIERIKWEYLKRRKAWYLCPMEWDRFAAPGVSRILDLGCGDGDVTQRIADHVAAAWQRDGHAGHDLEIVGLDLNLSRVENAAALCAAPHPGITMRFAPGDAIGEGVAYPDRHFDHVVNTNVIDLLNDADAERFIAEMCRVAAHGIYVADIAEPYPGGIVRDHLPQMFAAHGFRTVRDQLVLTEPFTVEGSRDPLKLWPVLKVRLLALERA